MTLPYMYEPSVLQHWIGIYRQALEEAGHDPATREVLGKFHIYVAESDDAARQEATPYLERYRTIANERNRNNLAGRPIRDRGDFEAEVARGNVIAGDASRCIDIINQWREALGLTTVSGTFYFGGMPQEMALRNIRLFAERVMPAFEEAPVASGDRQVPSPSGRG